MYELTHGWWVHGKYQSLCNRGLPTIHKLSFCLDVPESSRNIWLKHRFCLFLQFWYLILESFWQCSIFFLHFIIINTFTQFICQNSFEAHVFPVSYCSIYTTKWRPFNIRVDDWNILTKTINQQQSQWTNNKPTTVTVDKQ